MEQHPHKQEQLQGPEGTPDPARRSFLKAAPLGALAVVTGNAGAVEAPVAPVAAPDPAVKRGYHETEHIRRYYETAAYW
ncbi:formate dehydrogenase [Massilia yuzhufengensis]|uniref:Formate dehydrogenase region TAT target n=1 Tax=Massilia yuzhufengensis TaxID=1164594 RepID=A0A1I1QKC3_9BURK|nr:formate dehydrogenase [Massilia yuzhufengensis]SFD22571.1 formate dehydrogenase region TAT target [Massilia yuzhufengensis]